MATPRTREALADLEARLPELMLADQRRLRRRIQGARRAGAGRGVLDRLAADLDAAGRRVERRQAALPRPHYPAELPISARRDEIRTLIRDHQVVVIAGETGSGKTTQLPKMCLELGRGVRGMIGHTQPRRLAARTVAARIAEELGGVPGGVVGHKVRFTDQVGPDTLVKLMTDGILLAEIQGDRLLEAYDTLIIDEAHERSLNVDFILGYVKRLLPRRPDLKVIITSATIDPRRFAAHFDAPALEVSGRTYPVEVRYRPLDRAERPQRTERPERPERTQRAERDEREERDQTQGIIEAVDELCAEGPGDILVFLSGEREIRDTADALARHPPVRRAGVEILPLYARLSAAEQQRVFAAHEGRRIVLATNVAETSLTVPGIHYVIDPGTARISRYSHRTKVQRLPIEAISQASADQRKGRCGRVAEGVCVRLYSADDFAARPRYTDPEILRTNLASVILQMTALGLGEVTEFPFIDPPDRRGVRDGVALLRELSAFEPVRATGDGEPAGAAGHRLTPLGRRLARLPVDPRIGRMVLAAGEFDCVREILVIAAALSIQDPRERPVDAREAARESHARFDEPGSDFLAFLNLWNHLAERQRELSGSRFRRLCRAEFLNYLRVREWQDLHGQLRQLAGSLDLAIEPGPPSTADPVRIHQALLAGLLSHFGRRDGDKREYLGARGTRFAIFPGSALADRPPGWVMAAELVETSRLWGRIAARIEPEWVEPLAGHLLVRSYSEPHWDPARGAVQAYERVTVYGVPIVAGRTVGYARVDPALSRELFIRHALVDGDWDTHHAFLRTNQDLVEEVAELEHRARRRDLLADDEALFAFYDARIPADVVSGRHFDAWWKRTRRQQPDLLTFDRQMLFDPAAVAGLDEDFPGVWRHDGLELPLRYTFEPGSPADGVSVEIPLEVLNRVDERVFGWQVPGLREELVTTLIRSLPKQLRRSLVPAPDHARAVLARLRPGSEPLLDALERELARRAGTAIPRDAWQLDRLPEHLIMTYRVVGEGGETLAEGKDLAEIKRRLAPRVRATLAAATGVSERRGLRDWSLDELPRTVTRRHGGREIQAYPALADEGDSVAVRMFETPERQRAEMWRGTRRLLLLNVPDPARYALNRLSQRDKLALGQHPYGSASALFDDCVAAATDKIIEAAGGPAYDAAGFAALLARARAELGDIVVGLLGTVAAILSAAREVDRRLGAGAGPAVLPSLTDVREQLSGLVHPGFISATGWRRLPDVERYLRAIVRRLEKLPDDPHRDRELVRRLEPVRQAYQRALARPDGSAARARELVRIRWMIEELRVSYFAQTLGTAQPVSDKRIFKALDALPA